FHCRFGDRPHIFFINAFGRYPVVERDRPDHVHPIAERETEFFDFPRDLDRPFSMTFLRFLGLVLPKQVNECQPREKTGILRVSDLVEEKFISISEREKFTAFENVRRPREFGFWLFYN